MSNKKTLIRLEQGFHSSINRAIVRHGAFAILYGMHLKYYIKTPEVITNKAFVYPPVIVIFPLNEIST